MQDENGIGLNLKLMEFKNQLVRKMDWIESLQ